MANAHGGCGERIDRTIKEEEVDLSAHHHYTAAAFQSGLVFAETYPQGVKVRGRSLAEFEGQTLTLSLEATGLTATHFQPTRGRRTNAR